jgi:hypothetical protein
MALLYCLAATRPKLTTVLLQQIKLTRGPSTSNIGGAPFHGQARNAPANSLREIAGPHYNGSVLEADGDDER